MNRWTCEACSAWSDELWGACPSCRELRPVERGWPDGSSLVLLYPGDTQVDAAGRYRSHAQQLLAAGYVPVATSWGEERPGAGTALFAAQLEEAYRIGTLLVTYRRAPIAVAEPGVHGPGAQVTSGLTLDAIVVPGDQAELVRYPADDIRLRLVGHGDVQVADYTSVDRDGPPAHSHPWDELQIVVEGAAEIRIGDGPWVAGGSGTVQALPAGVAHAIRVPEGAARIIQVSIGAPYDGFAREMARLFGAGAPLEEIVTAAGGFGVKLG